MPLAFLDTETTGLDPALHDVWEVAYAIDGGPVTTLALPHSVEHADPQALEVNGYYQRANRPVDEQWREQLLAELDGVTLVGANPGFDVVMLGKALGAKPWKYRTIDVSTAVMWLAGWDEPKGLRGAALELRHRGFVIPLPDHTAAGDVTTARAIYRVVRPLLQRTTARTTTRR